MKFKIPISEIWRYSLQKIEILPRLEASVAKAEEASLDTNGGNFRGIFFFFHFQLKIFCS